MGVCWDSTPDLSHSDLVNISDKCDHPESDLLYAADNYLRGLCLHAIANTGGHAERLPVVLSRPSRK